MEKNDISKLILSKSDRIAFLPGEGKSDVWPHFMRVVVDGVLSYHVMCNDCKSVLKWKAKDGMNGLKAHTQSCKGNKHGAGVSRKLTDCAGVSTQPTVKHVSAADKRGVTEAVVRFCARDIHPFNTVEGKDFMYDTHSGKSYSYIIGYGYGYSFVIHFSLNTMQEYLLYLAS